MKALSPLRDIDAGERAQLLRIGVWFAGPCFIILTALWYFLQEKGVIPGWLFGVLVICNIPLTALGVIALNHTATVASRGLVNTITAAGNIAPPRTYPRQEVLIVRGAYREAADYFQDHLTVDPDDDEARLRLAGLLEQHLGDPVGAERLYLEVRRRAVVPGYVLRASNGLIDLYRQAGRRDRLMVELARFADRYRGTPGADAAARLLAELKAESEPAE